MRGIFGLFGLALSVGLACAMGLRVPPVFAADAPSPAAPGTIDAEARSILCGRAMEQSRFVPAHATEYSKPRFPRDDLKEWSEGWVAVGYDVGGDGVAKNLEVLDRLGSKQIVAATIDAISRWRFRPGMFDGKPVEQHNNRYEVIYQFDDLQREAVHETMVRRYQRGTRLLKDGDTQGAIVELESAFSLRLNLYEQSRLSHLLAIAYLRLGNAPRALQHIRHATLNDGAFLEKNIASAAWRLQLLLEARDSNFQYVACSEPLLKSDSADEDAAERDEVKRAVGVVEAALANPQPMVVAAVLAVNPWVEGSAVWEHPLIRRKFAFNATNGAVKTFKLACFTQIVEGKVDDTSQWSVPVSAGPCMLRVYGDAGAKFQLIEEW